MTENDKQPKTNAQGVSYTLDSEAWKLLRSNPDFLLMHLKNVNRSFDPPTQEGAPKEQPKDSPSVDNSL